jgi:hypothetical protein
MPIPVFARHEFRTLHGPTTNVTNHLCYRYTPIRLPALLDLEVVRPAVAWTNGFGVE